jgi:hypothetical protein
MKTDDLLPTDEVFQVARRVCGVLTLNGRDGKRGFSFDSREFASIRG